MKTHLHNIQVDDTELAHQACTNAEAFAELYRRHVTRVYRYHLAQTGNVKDAEDLTSQTFMAALEGICSFRGRGSFAAWVMGIASRKRALFFRGRIKEIPLDEDLHRTPADRPTDKAAAQKLQKDQVLRALRQLSPDRSEVLILCFFSGLSPAEAGRVLGKNQAAVRMLISRGLHDLRTRTSLALELDDE